MQLSSITTSPIWWMTHQIANPFNVVIIFSTPNNIHRRNQIIRSIIKPKLHKSSFKWTYQGQFPSNIQPLKLMLEEESSDPWPTFNCPVSSVCIRYLIIFLVLYFLTQKLYNQTIIGKASLLQWPERCSFGLFKLMYVCI